MTLTSCCGCFSLKTGTISIGILSLISTIISLIMTIIGLCRIEQESNIKNGNQNSYFSIRSMFIAAIVYIAIMLLFSAMLIVGAKHRKATLIFPYLCLSFTGISILISAALGFFSFLIISPSVVISVALVTVLLVLSILALNIYLWMVIYRFYQELLAENFGRKINPSTGKIFREPFEQDV